MRRDGESTELGEDGGTKPTHGADTPIAPEAIETVEEVLQSFVSVLGPPVGGIDAAHQLMVDVLTAHPLGYILGERLREHVAGSRTEERTKLSESSAQAEDDTHSRASGSSNGGAITDAIHKKARGAG